MSAIRKRLIGPGILEAQKEIGPAKSCLCNESRSRLVATFCFLSCGTSSSLPSWSRRHKMLNASAVLRAMQGARNSFSQLERSARIGCKIKRSGSLDLLMSLVERVRTCGSLIAGREADRVDANRHGPQL